MPQVLQITENTVLKRRPLQSSALSAEEVYKVDKGTSYELQSYAYADTNGDDFNDHIKFALKQDNIQGFNTWYVYELHSQVVQDGTVVYPQEEPEAAQIVKVVQDTVFKRRPLPASQLAPDEIQSIPAGRNFVLQSYAYADENGGFNSHVKLALGNTSDYIRGISSWYVYDQHAKILLDGELVYPLPQQTLSVPPPSAIPSGRFIMLPGYSSKFFLNQPIIPNGSFTWGEATHDGSRIPKTKKIADNIIALATALEKPRKQLGKPFKITSWYRPAEVNSGTRGAASNSQHLYGKAIDFYVPGYTPRQVAKELAWWNGGLGTYPSWNHLDIGSKRRW
ncbi:DUF882 domain-containing protein [Oculatella sp. LEGE 06141]|uniref:YcbK family protein n=1 Tax=Oculatella sp. LEGE 06141 TaxID=1828648 RepID=UPI0018801DAD|nr:D-Ala-D-Ala carboxypeptidase family metallohydrolase [Oculatella sp. LEGE 06141]MBE9179156.1 DUF882 domain-containing protein [Oculatella sp. LEGE 06141]